MKVLSTKGLGSGHCTDKVQGGKGGIDRGGVYMSKLDMRKKTLQMKSENRASLVCQIMTNLRCKQEIECAEIVKIIKKEKKFDRNTHLKYFLGFFENCRPELIKKFMSEQGISRRQVIDVFEKLDNFGEVYKFRQAVANGKF